MINKLNKIIQKLNEKLAEKDKIIEELENKNGLLVNQPLPPQILKPTNRSSGGSRRSFTEKFRGSVEGFRESNDVGIQVDLINDFSIIIPTNTNDTNDINNINNNTNKSTHNHSKIEECFSKVFTYNKPLNDVLLLYSLVII